MVHVLHDSNFPNYAEQVSTTAIIMEEKRDALSVKQQVVDLAVAEGMNMKPSSPTS